MHRTVVDEKKWVDEARFLHALNFCMLLPGPEAQKLATYLGWLLHGVRGGLGRRHPVRAAGRLRDAGLEPALRARARRPAHRRRTVRHQGRRAGDRGRGADPHRQARAQDLIAARAGGGGFRRHFLSGAAVSADRGGGGTRRLSGRAPGAGAARHRGQDRKRAAAGQRPLAAIRHRIAGRIASVVGAGRARGARLRPAACAGRASACSSPSSRW